MKLLLPPEDIQKRRGIVLSPEKTHYLIRVLRFERGDFFTVIDGRGRSYRARVSGLTSASPAGRQVAVDIVEDLPSDPDSPFPLTLCQGLLKGEKMDLVVQKTTELGVHEIQPLVTERSIVRHTRKVPRWRKIAEEASEQCGRATAPLIQEPRDLAAFLADRGSLSGVVLWEEGGLPLPEALAQLNVSSPPGHSPESPAFSRRARLPLALIVGPEGGLSPSEVLEARSRGLVPATLGSRTLRAETAAIVGIALTQFILEHGRP